MLRNREEIVFSFRRRRRRRRRRNRVFLLKLFCLSFTAY